VADEATDRHGASTPGQTPGARLGAPRPGAPAIDLQRLADKVYGLMLAEVRLSTARGESTRWGKVR
jgi:hypothetical protein